MSEVLAALLGAFLTGLFQTIVGIRDRSRESDSVLSAIASEVDSICRLIRHQKYKEFSHSYVTAINEGIWDGSTIIVDLRQNYFTVFEGLVGRLGLLKAVDACKIVNFYAYCKSAIDSSYPDGVHAKGDLTEFVAANIVSLDQLLGSILALGDEIIQLPKISIQITSSPAAQVTHDR